MLDDGRLAAQFEAQRPHLRAVAYRMLGSVSDAEDAVQEAWIRLDRSDSAAIDDLPAWLTTVVARISLNQLRARTTRRETSLENSHVPEPVVSAQQGLDPEQAVLVGDAVGLALQVVLETLAPAERLAFVLHDIFGLPFERIAPIVERSPAAARQLASRARRRVRAAPQPAGDVEAQWAVVDAFMAAAQGGDFEALVAILDPDVVVRSDGGPTRPQLDTLVRGAAAVAGQAMSFRRFAEEGTKVLVNGAPGGLAWLPDGRPFAVLGLTIARGRILEIDILADPERLGRLTLPRR